MEAASLSDSQDGEHDLGDKSKSVEGRSDLRESLKDITNKPMMRMCFLTRD